MRLLIKFPTRGRKDKFFTTLNKYVENITEKETSFLVSLDSDDNSMNNPEVLDKLSKYQNLKFTLGDSKSKIDAVNRDINPNNNWDIILLASDDMIPQVKGFDKVIVDLMVKNYPDTDGILFFNDGFKKNELNTLCILGKKYYNRFGYIYYPGYKSTWSDNEFTKVGNILKKQTYIPLVIIKHEHPDWGYGNRDVIHSKNFEDVNFDMNLFHSREKINFEL